MSGRKLWMCKSRITLPNNKGYGYYLCPVNNINNVIYVSSSELKQKLSNEPDIITNLKLTSDNRIICKKDSSEQYKTRATKQEKAYDTIYVSDLISGHVVNQNIFVPINGKQTSGEISNSKDNKCNKLIVGTGYICNDEKIALIKKYYSGKCTLKIMTPYDVRTHIIRNRDFRNRLAIFYANQMRNAEYMHLDRIKSEKAKKIYEYIKKTLLISKYLEKDPNLLMIMFILYGYHMYTFEHSVDVAIYACMLYSILHKDMSKEDLHDLFLCGLLHDIGKISVSVDILDKGGKLSDNELIRMQQHPSVSCHIINQLCNCDSEIFIQFKNNDKRRKRLIDGALYHHKNNYKSDNGRTGYPEELCVQSKVEEYDWFLRIISVADCLDGMLSPRPYRARKGVKPNIDVGQRDYIGASQAINFLTQDMKNNKLGEAEVNAVKILLYGDDAHDFDDIYGNKITNIMINMDLISNYKDITKFEDYIE